VPATSAAAAAAAPWCRETRWQQQQQLKTHLPLFTAASPVFLHQHQQQHSHHSTAAPGAPTTGSSTGPSSSQDSSTRNSRGALPKSGPSHRALRALPFTVSRASAAQGFQAYHAKHW
jgi:hypothetical protein